MTSEPRTAEGRLLAAYELHDFDDRPISVASEIAAIESEARSLALSEVEAAVTGLRREYLANHAQSEIDAAEFGPKAGAQGRWKARVEGTDAVLTAITALREGTKA